MGGATRKAIAAGAVLALAAVALWNFWKESPSPAVVPGVPPESGRSGRIAARMDFPEESPSSHPGAAPMPRGPSENEPSGKMSISDFERLNREVSSSLPTLAQLRDLDAEEKHGTPAAIQGAGMALGKIARALQENPELHASGLSFYEGCASRDDLPRSIRALCYSNLKNLALKSALGEEPGADVPTDIPADITEEVRDLAHELDH